MRIAEMNWMQVEQLAARERRAVLPLGSTEQHAQLSLCVDVILAERVAVEAAEPLAMVLPIPVAEGAKETDLRFINLEKYPTFFGDLNKGFPVPVPAGSIFGGKSRAKAPAAAP